MSVYTVGERVRFDYNDKFRVGVIEKIVLSPKEGLPYLVLKCPKGTTKNYTLSKIGRLD